MTATNKIDAIGWLRKQLEQAPDPIREALAEVIMMLMNPEADAMCGAAYGKRSTERVNQLNGYGTRPWETRVARSRWRSPSCAMEAIPRRGCSSRVVVPSRR